MKVKDLMVEDVKCCVPFNSCNTAAELMWENDCGCVPVIDHDRKVLGMLTDRDISMAAYTQGLPLASIIVTSAMSKQVYSCRLDDELEKVEATMLAHQVRRLPVLDHDQRLVGIISLSDIAREAQHEAEMRKPRMVGDLEVAQVLAAVCEPRHRIVVAHAA